MKQQTLAMAADQGDGFEPYRKQTKRDTFLATMEQIVPWQELCSVIEPHYPRAGNGRPPIGLERMLRMYFVQHWFNLADEACEEALLDSTALRRFVGIDLGPERVPDGTTLLKFRRLLEKHQLGEALFATVGEVLQARGMKVGTGTIVDATIIGAPSSTKNADKQRDPEMHQTRKGQQWYFGMKMHIGVDSRTGLAHSAVVTAANVHDKHPLPGLLHGNEQRVYGDSAYASQKMLIGSKAPKATRPSARRTTTSPKSVPGSNMSLPWSSDCGALPRCATEALPRTPRARSWCWVWPISTWRASASWHECVRCARPVREQGLYGQEPLSNRAASQRQRPRAQRLAQFGYLFSVALSCRPLDRPQSICSSRLQTKCRKAGIKLGDHAEGQRACGQLLGQAFMPCRWPSRSRPCSRCRHGRGWGRYGSVGSTPDRSFAVYLWPDKGECPV